MKGLPGGPLYRFNLWLSHSVVDRVWRFGPPSDITETAHSSSLRTGYDPSYLALSVQWESTADDRSVQVRVGPFDVAWWGQPTRRARRLGLEYVPVRKVQRHWLRRGRLHTWTAYWDWRHIGASVRAGWVMPTVRIRLGPVGLEWKLDRDPSQLHLARCGLAGGAVAA